MVGRHFRTAPTRSSSSDEPTTGKSTDVICAEDEDSASHENGWRDDECIILVERRAVRRGAITSGTLRDSRCGFSLAGAK
ncbi:hypothetical protein SLG_00700 [Sphingobium sp. SYK-6]|nr:hypothetical protein SLG_00700 [Sphingobium sp. SYK-6]